MRLKFLKCDVPMNGRTDRLEVVNRYLDKITLHNGQVTVTSGSMGHPSISTDTTSLRFSFAAASSLSLKQSRQAEWRQVKIMGSFDEHLVRQNMHTVSWPTIGFRYSASCWAYWADISSVTLCLRSVEKRKQKFRIIHELGNRWHTVSKYVNFLHF